MDATPESVVGVAGLLVAAGSTRIALAAAETGWVTIATEAALGAGGSEVANV
jgi:hypothetical protein